MTAKILKYPTRTERKLYHKASCAFPIIKGAEFDALVDDIKARGLIHPIILCEDRILDGRNRYRACRRAGVLPRYEKFTGSDPIAYVISANVVRRHLSREQIRDIIAQEIKRRPDLSDRQIAKTVKVHQTTVGNVRIKMEASGRVSKLDTRTDTKGRMQPARKPRKQKIPRISGIGRRTHEVENTGCNYNGARDDPHDRACRHRSFLWFNDELKRMYEAYVERLNECKPSELDGLICDGVQAFEKAHAEWKRVFYDKADPTTWEKG